MPDRAMHRSLSRAVYAEIRADILAGRGSALLGASDALYAAAARRWSAA